MFSVELIPEEAKQIYDCNWAWAAILRPSIVEAKDGSFSLQVNEVEAGQFRQVFDEFSTLSGAGSTLYNKLVGLYGNILQSDPR